MSTHTSKPCCERPVATSQGYSTKGSYETLANTKCYISGPAHPKKALLIIYDIFGFREQTLQGADLLASGGKEEYLVIMPDMFHGNTAEPIWFSDKEKYGEQIGAFFGSIQDPAPRIQHVEEVLQAAKAKFASVDSWGAIGFCWGGKIVSVTSGPDTPWKVAVQTSPAMLDPKDAASISIPFATLASGEETAADVKAFDENLKSPKKLTETFQEQVHGWMSARADLSDPQIKSEYERGYQIVLDFLATHF